jgi:hypothetical protein
MDIAQHQSEISRLEEENRLRREGIRLIASALQWDGTDDAVIRVGALRERLHRLAETTEELDDQVVAWTLDTDGRYFGSPLVES